MEANDFERSVETAQRCTISVEIDWKHMNWLEKPSLRRQADKRQERLINLRQNQPTFRTSLRRGPQTISAFLTLIGIEPPLAAAGFFEFP